MRTHHCGLDFGTSNSTLAMVGANGMPRLMPLEGDSLTLPSVIFFSFEDDGTYFGRAALAEHAGDVRGRIMRALKSVLGTNLVNDVTRIRDSQFAFTDIIGLFLGHLRTQAEAAIGGEIAHVVVGRPVHFVDDDQAADADAQAQLERAVRKQGFAQVEFQFEPIAAALDYEQQVTAEELVLVVDIGGGTSDFSVVRVSPERAKSADRQGDILATAGVHIGGTDFDRMLSMTKAMPQLGSQTETADGKRVLPAAPYYDLATWHRINRLYNPQSLRDLRHTRREAAHPELVEQMIALVEDRQGHRLAASIEDAKIALTEAEAVAWQFASRDVALSSLIARADLAYAVGDAVGRIAAMIDETLVLAGIGKDQVQTLILTGGSTQIPAIMAMLHAALPRAKFVATDAFGSVGLGLALDAARKFGPRAP